VSCRAQPTEPEPSPHPSSHYHAESTPIIVPFLLFGLIGQDGRSDCRLSSPGQLATNTQFVRIYARVNRLVTGLQAGSTSALLHLQSYQENRQPVPEPSRISTCWVAAIAWEAAAAMAELPAPMWLNEKLTCCCTGIIEMLLATGRASICGC